MAAFFVLLAGCGSLGSNGQTASLSGHWHGMIRHGGEWNLARLELRQEATALAGTISVPALGLKDAAVTGGVDAYAAWIEFRAAERGTVRLDGSLQDNLLRSGTDPVTTKWPFFLAPLSNVAQASLQEYIGSYAYAPGQEFLLLPASEAGLRFFELGRLSGTLLPLATGVLITSPLVERGRSLEKGGGMTFALIVGGVVLGGFLIALGKNRLARNNRQGSAELGVHTRVRS